MGGLSRVSELDGTSQFFSTLAQKMAVIVLPHRVVVQNEGVSIGKALRIVFKSVPNTAQEMRVWAVCSLLVHHCPRESKIPGAPTGARLKVGEWRKERARRELTQAALYVNGLG